MVENARPNQIQRQRNLLSDFVTFQPSNLPPLQIITLKSNTIRATINPNLHTACRVRTAINGMNNDCDSGFVESSVPTAS